MVSLRRFREKWLRTCSRMMLLAFLCSNILSLGLCIQSAYADAPAGDPGGSATGTAADVVDAGGSAFVVSKPTDTTAPDYATKMKAYTDYTDQVAKEPLALKLADGVGQNRIAINFVWTLVTGYLVMFMQAGFAMVECGLCRAKNAAHVFMTNFMIYGIGMLGFWIAGFAFMFGSMGGAAPANLGGIPSINGPDFHGLIGTHGFFLSGNTYDTAAFTLFLFQMVFMDTTATIPTGAMAERWKWSAFVVYGFFVSIIVYPIYGHWVWGNGWLANIGTNWHLGHGAVDFAGSGVVHAIGGWTALAGAMVLGPRIGKYSRDGKPNVLAAHNLPMALIGCFILAFGWFGFNPGSTLGASGAGNLRIGVIATNTMLASAGGAMAAMLYMMARTGKPDPGMCGNGLLAGLVAITAPCAFINSVSAVIIGVIAGVVVCISCVVVERAGVDDPVGAISVHGVCGIWGVLSVGIFADGVYGAGWNGVGAATYLGKAGMGVTGLLYGDWSQFAAQVVDSVVNIVWAFGISYLFFKAQKAIMGIRSKPEDEIAGLDIPEMGVLAYQPDEVAVPA